MINDDAWIESIFSNGPVYVLKTRTRRTHRFGIYVQQMARWVYVEGTEINGLYALLYLQNLGYVYRFKEQPFTLKEEAVGGQYTPDFLVETEDGTFVVECKSARFVTYEVEKTLEIRDQFLRRYNLSVLLWTDLQPLTLSLRTNLRRMFRLASEPVSEDETSRLQDTLEQQRVMTLRQVLDCGCDLDAMLKLAWFGKAHLDLMGDINDKSEFTVAPTHDLAGLLFGSRPDTSAWWNSLPRN